MVVRPLVVLRFVYWSWQIRAIAKIEPSPIPMMRDQSGSRDVTLDCDMY